jgi:glutamyl-tRNA synthetase
VTAVRFAPSPTGPLHLGNARAAVINWLFARKTQGRFLLRFDDTDRERSREEFARAIETDLAWLGLGWDLFARQSERLALYAGVAEKLKASGRLYPCFETAEELELKRKLAQRRGKSWIYDRAALSLSAKEVEQRMAGGETPYWRFKLDHQPILWDDLIRGRVEFNGAHLSDPVLIRADGTPLYTFTSVVDDVELEITHVIRGEDHVTTTAVQIQIFAALGYAAPAFAHFSLILGRKGETLSKRLDALSLARLREDGIEPMAVNSLLAKIGTADPVEPRASLAALVAEFDLAKFGRAPPYFDSAELVQLNAELLHLLPYEAVAHRLPDGAEQAFWEAVRPNLERFGEVELWWRVCSGLVAARRAPQDRDFLAKAAELLPMEPFDATTWDRWVEQLKQATGRQGKDLLMPLRRVLTGRDYGPELRNLLPLIGRDRALRRLGGKTA